MLSRMRARVRGYSPFEDSGDDGRFRYAGAVTESERTPPSRLISVVAVLVLAAIGATLATLLAHDVKQDRGAVPWGALVVGGVALLSAVFERDGRPDVTKRVGLGTGLLYFAGPNGSRLLIGLFAGAGIGLGIAMVTGVPH